MDLNKLSTADKVIGGAAIAFLITMLMPWWGIDGAGSNSGFDYWLTGILPLLLVVVMVGQIIIDRFTTTQLPEIPLKWGQVHLIAGVAVAVLVVLRHIVPSDIEAFGGSVDLARRYATFLAAIAAIGVGVGGFLKSKEPESVYDSGPRAYPGTQPPPPPGGASFWRPDTLPRPRSGGASARPGGAPRADRAGPKVTR